MGTPTWQAIEADERYSALSEEGKAALRNRWVLSNHYRMKARYGAGYNPADFDRRLREHWGEEYNDSVLRAVGHGFSYSKEYQRAELQRAGQEDFDRGSAGLPPSAEVKPAQGTAVAAEPAQGTAVAAEPAQGTAVAVEPAQSTLGRTRGLGEEMADVAKGTAFRMELSEDLHRVMIDEEKLGGHEETRRDNIREIARVQQDMLEARGQTYSDVPWLPASFASTATVMAKAYKDEALSAGIAAGAAGLLVGMAFGPVTAGTLATGGYKLGHRLGMLSAFYKDGYGDMARALLTGAVGEEFSPAQQQMLELDRLYADGRITKDVYTERRRQLKKVTAKGVPVNYDHDQVKFLSSAYGFTYAVAEELFDVILPGAGFIRGTPALAKIFGTATKRVMATWATRSFTEMMEEGIQSFAFDTVMAIANEINDAGGKNEGWTREAIIKAGGSILTAGPVSALFGATAVGGFKGHQREIIIDSYRAAAERVAQATGSEYTPEPEWTEIHPGGAQEGETVTARRIDEGTIQMRTGEGEPVTLSDGEGNEVLQDLYNRADRLLAQEEEQEGEAEIPEEEEQAGEPEQEGAQQPEAQQQPGEPTEGTEETEETAEAEVPGVDSLSPGDTAYIYWAASERDEPVNFRGREGDNAVVVKDGQQLRVPLDSLKMSPDAVSEAEEQEAVARAAEIPEEEEDLGEFVLDDGRILPADSPVFRQAAGHDTPAGFIEEYSRTAWQEEVHGPRLAEEDLKKIWRHVKDRQAAGAEVPAEEAGETQGETGVRGLPPAEPGSETGTEPGASIQYPVEYSDTGELGLDAERFQFRGQTDEGGVKEENRLEGDWRELFATGAILVWEDKNGKRWVVNGHHRYDLARRRGVEKLAVQVVRESDGISAEEAKVLGAELNIADGKGSIDDFVEYFRGTELTEEAAKQRSLLGWAKARHGFQIGRFAETGLYTAFKNEKIKAGRAAAISEAAPNDEALQAAGLKYALENPRMAADGLRQFVKALSARMRLAPESEQDQGDLFGRDDSAMRRAALEGKIAREMGEAARQERTVLRNVMRRPDKEQLTPDQAEKYGISDPSDTDAVESALRQVEAEADRWKKWDTDDELSERVFAEADRLAAGDGVDFELQEVLPGSDAMLEQWQYQAFAQKANGILELGDELPGFVRNAVENLLRRAGAGKIDNWAEASAKLTDLLEAKAKADSDIVGGSHEQQGELFDTPGQGELFFDMADTPLIEAARLLGSSHYKELLTDHAEELQAAVDDVWRRLPNALPVRVVPSEADLPAGVTGGLAEYRKASRDRGRELGQIRGARTDEAVWLNAEVAADAAEALASNVHEQVVHHGFRVAFTARERAILYDQLLDSVGIETIQKAILKAYHGRTEHVQAEEYIARIAGKVVERQDLTEIEQTAWQRIVNWLRKMLRRILTGEASESLQGRIKRATDLDGIEARRVARMLQESIAGLQEDATAGDVRILADPPVVYGDKALTAEQIARNVTTGSRTEAEHAAGYKGQSWPTQYELYTPELPEYATEVSGTAGVSDRAWGARRKAVSGVRFGTQPLGQIDLNHMKVDSPQDAAELIWQMRNPENEKIIMVGLDADRNVLPDGVVLLGVGALDRSSFSTRSALAAAERMGAEKILFVHNHPSGDPNPSGGDFAVTNAIRTAIETVDGPEMVDHIILDHEKFYSFAHNGFRPSRAWSPRFGQYRRVRAGEGDSAGWGRAAISVMGEWGADMNPSPAERREILGFPERPEKIDGPADLAALVQPLVGPHNAGVAMVIGVNFKRYPVATVLMTAEDDPREIYRRVALSGGVSRIITVYDQSGGPISEGMAERLREVKDIAEAPGADLPDMLDSQVVGVAGVQEGGVNYEFLGDFIPFSTAYPPTTTRRQALPSSELTKTAWRERGIGKPDRWVKGRPVYDDRPDRLPPMPVSDERREAAPELYEALREPRVYYAIPTTSSPGRGRGGFTYPSVLFKDVDLIAEKGWEAAEKEINLLHSDFDTRYKVNRLTGGDYELMEGTAPDADGRQADAEYLRLAEEPEGNREELQEMVVEAAKRSGLPVLPDDEQLSFTHRRKPAPKRTIKAYKLFKMRDGKLYSLFVGANSAVPVGVWLDAKGEQFYELDARGRKRVPAKTGEWTLMADGSKKKTVAFRPGWHSGDMPHAQQIAPKNERGEKSRYADDVWVEIEIPADEDYASRALANASITKAGKPNMREAQLDYIPTDGYYPYTTNPNAIGTWYISGAVKLNRILTEDEGNQILRQRGIDPMPWIGGQQDLAAYGITPGAKTSRAKLLDPVTYDEQGNVIPLSERFNPQEDDTRYELIGEYLRLAEEPEGNREELQRMVDAAAEAAGYVSEKLFHGTDRLHPFTVFDVQRLAEVTGHPQARLGFYFTPNETYAGEYPTNLTADRRRIISVYLRLQNPKHIPVNELYEALPRRVGAEAGDTMRQALIDQGYDGIILTEASVPDFRVTIEHDVHIAFYPEQVKSADPVTYDEQGNVIPLSERFNPQEDDTRYELIGEGEEAGRGEEGRGIKGQRPRGRFKPNRLYTTKGTTEDARGAVFNYRVQTATDDLGLITERIYSDDMGIHVRARTLKRLKEKMGQYKGEPMPLDGEDATRYELTGEGEEAGRGEEDTTPRGWPEGVPVSSPGLLNLIDLVEMATALQKGKRPKIKKHMQQMGLFTEPLRGDPFITLAADGFIGPRLARVMLSKNAATAEMQEEMLIGRILEAHPELTGEELIIHREQRERGIEVIVNTRDHDYVNRVIAHELGHAYGWFDEGTLARGNILGHVAALHNYCKKMIGGTPDTAEGLISTKERGRIRTRARQQVRAEHQIKDREIDESDALREEVSEVYAQLLDKTRLARGLVTRGEITQELTGLSRWWRPFDPDTAEESYVKYRQRPDELYADAISVMFNSPSELKRRAPKFYRLFTAYLSARPEATGMYRAVIDAARSGQTMTGWVQRFYGAMRKTEEAWRKLAEEEKWGLNRVKLLGRELFQTRHAAILAAEKEKHGSAYTAEDSPMAAIEEARWITSRAKAYIDELAIKILKPIRGADLTLELFNEVLFHNRVLFRGEGGRYDLANPGGIRPEGRDSSRSRLEEIREQLTEEQWRVIEAARSDFNRIRQKNIIARAEAAGMWPEELLEIARDNNAYMYFQVIAYMDDKYGEGSGARVFRQMGTLQDIAPGFQATVARDLQMIEAIAWNEAKTSTLRLLGDMGVVEKADTRYNGRYLVPVDRSGKGKSMLTVMDRGTMRGYYVPERVTQSFSVNDPKWLQDFKFCMHTMAQPAREIFVNLKPGFAAYNYVRDSARMAALLPGWNVTAKLAKQREAAVLLYRARRALEDAEGGEVPALIRDMQQKGQLMYFTTRTEATELDTQMGRMLKEYHLHESLKDVEGLPGWMAVLKFLHNEMRSGQRGVEHINKVAARLYLDEYYPDMSEGEKSHIIRTRAGSPDFQEKGQLTFLTNSVWLFSNPAVQALYSDMEAMREDKGVIGRYAAMVLPIKLIESGLVSGVMYKMARAVWGDDDDRTEKIRQWTGMERMIPQHDRDNYTCVPLALTPQGQLLYLRLPMDERARSIKLALSGLLDAAGAHDDPKRLMQAMKYTAEQLPGMHPGFDIIPSLWGYFVSNTNYIDGWSGRPIMDEDLFAARFTPEGWKPAAAELAKREWRYSGLNVFYDPPSQFQKDRPRLEGVPGAIQTLDETAYLAFVNDVLGRFVKVSDRGISDLAWEEVLTPMREDKLAQRWMKRNLARRLAEDGHYGELSDNEAWLLGQEGVEGDIERMMRDMRAQKGIDAFRRTLEQTRTQAEEDAVLRYFNSDEGFRPDFPEEE